MKKNGKLSVGFLFDDTLDSSDGVAQYVKTLGAWLSSQGHEVSYLVGQTRLRQWHEGKVYSLTRNVKVSFNGNRLSMPLPAKKQTIKEVFAGKQFDVLHVQVPYSPFMAQKVLNLAPASTVVVGTFHIFPSGKLASFGARLLHVICRRSLGRFFKIVSVSIPAANFAKETFKITTDVVPNAVDLSRFSGQQTTPKLDVNIVFLGRLVKRKGCMELLKAFAVLQEKCPQAILKIAGDGPERAKLEKFVKRQGLSDKVSFLGFIKEEDKAKLLASAEIACFPSLYGESFGIVLVEAMAAGAGVVLGGNNPGYGSVLGSKPELLISPKNSNEFAGRLELFLRDKKLSASLHAWQTENVKQYDVSVVGQEILDIYAQAIVNQTQRRHT